MKNPWKLDIWAYQAIAVFIANFFIIKYSNSEFALFSVPYGAFCIYLFLSKREYQQNQIELTEESTSYIESTSKKYLTVGFLSVYFSSMAFFYDLLGFPSFSQSTLFKVVYIVFFLAGWLLILGKKTPLIETTYHPESDTDPNKVSVEEELFLKNFSKKLKLKQFHISSGSLSFKEKPPIIAIAVFSAICLGLIVAGISLLIENKNDDNLLGGIFTIAFGAYGSWLFLPKLIASLKPENHWSLVNKYKQILKAPYDIADKKENKQRTFEFKEIKLIQFQRFSELIQTKRESYHRYHYELHLHLINGKQFRIYNLFKDSSKQADYKKFIFIIGQKISELSNLELEIKDNE